MNTLAFLLKNRRFLGFGLACTLASNFGQTFFIALFGGTIRAEFQLGHADFGALYATATLISAAWADTFGVRHLGKVRSITASLTVLSTAIAPVWAGWLLDSGWSILAIAISAAAIAAVSGLLVLIPARELRQRRSEKFP